MRVDRPVAAGAKEETVNPPAPVDDDGIFEDDEVTIKRWHSGLRKGTLFVWSALWEIPDPLFRPPQIPQSGRALDRAYV